MQEEFNYVLVTDSCNEQITKPWQQWKYINNSLQVSVSEHHVLCIIANVDNTLGSCDLPNAHGWTVNNSTIRHDASNLCLSSSQYGLRTSLSPCSTKDEVGENTVKSQTWTYIAESGVVLVGSAVTYRVAENQCLSVQHLVSNNSIIYTLDGDGVSYCLSTNISQTG